MATYFHGTPQEIIHSDGLQKLLLMNSGYPTDAAAPSWFAYPTTTVNFPTAGGVFHAGGQNWQQPLPQVQQGLSLSLSPQEARGSALVDSKYLRATQQLLEEVVHLGKLDSTRAVSKPGKAEVEEGTGGDASSGKPAVELAAGERQELHMKKAKLVQLLDEVELRYKQYEQQMQAVTASFETVAGAGAGRAYTALALGTISRRFRRLKEAICGQIRAAGRSLGEEEFLQASGGHQLRQQRSLQSLGMMQHNAWRPQRGLPERSVSVLRAWLFEHFLHPYPKDADKLLLAKQTGLTRSQVSNWFINARVRLWKPMVEEMYMEEMKLRETGNSPADNEPRRDDSLSRSPAPPPVEASTDTELEQSNSSGSKQPEKHSPPAIMHYNCTQEMLRPAMKKARACVPPALETMALPMEMEMEVKPYEAGHSDLFMGFGEQHHGYNLNLFASGAYPIGDIARFSTDGVSLSLGLHRSGAPPPYPGDGYVMADEANEYCSLNGGSPTLPDTQSAYGGLGIQSGKGFAVQLLPDFVA